MVWGQRGEKRRRKIAVVKQLFEKENHFRLAGEQEMRGNVF
jgi:hypothetical protein